MNPETYQQIQLALEQDDFATIDALLQSPRDLLTPPEGVAAPLVELLADQQFPQLWQAALVYTVYT